MGERFSIWMLLALPVIALAALVIGPAHLVVRFSRFLACFLVIALIAAAVSPGAPKIVESLCMIYGAALLIALAYPRQRPAAKQ